MKRKLKAKTRCPRCKVGSVSVSLHMVTATAEYLEETCDLCGWYKQRVLRPKADKSGKSAL